MSENDRVEMEMKSEIEGKKRKTDTSNESASFGKVQGKAENTIGMTDIIEMTVISRIYKNGYLL